MRTMAVVLTVLVVVGVLLAGCAPDPRNQAEADATTRASQADAADRAAARAQGQATFDLGLAERKAVSGQWVASVNEFLTWWMRAALVAASLATLGLGASLAIGMVGKGVAVAKAESFRATWIALDRETGNYPAVTYTGGGKFLIADPNTGKVLQADTRQEADRQMVAAAMGVRLAGVVTRNVQMMGGTADGTAMAGMRPVQVFDVAETLPPTGPGPLPKMKKTFGGGVDVDVDYSKESSDGK